MAKFRRIWCRCATSEGNDDRWRQRLKARSNFDGDSGILRLRSGQALEPSTACRNDPPFRPVGPEARFRDERFYAAINGRSSTKIPDSIDQAWKSGSFRAACECGEKSSPLGPAGLKPVFRNGRIYVAVNGRSSRMLSRGYGPIFQRRTIPIFPKENTGEICACSLWKSGSLEPRNPLASELRPLGPGGLIPVFATEDSRRP
jgi:hypothetical protein